MNQGYIKLYRKTEENPIVCKDNDYFRVWHYLLYNASHKKHKVDFNGTGILLKPGQLITGRTVLANKCNISESKAERILKRFEIEQQIEQQTCNKGRLITVVNWGKYQPDVNDSELQTGQQPNNNWTTTEQLPNTNNNDNNVNNEINNISTTSTTGERYGNERNGDENLFEYVEKLFGRTLNQIEFEVINGWQNNDVTKYAIGQAVLLDACSIKYIDKILFEYKKHNITTIEQAQKRDKEFQENKEKRKSFKKFKNETREFLDKEMERINKKNGL